MAGALTFLLTACLLQGALCGKFEIIIPNSIEVLSGSCVTIPCSFDIRDDLESKLDKTCIALWKTNGIVFDSRNPQQTTINGDLTKKNCTTTLNNMQPDHSNSYFLRLECQNPLKNNFLQPKISISIKDDPPTPTLTPSTLKEKEGTSVKLTCSAPAPCLSHPPTLTWTPGLGASLETLLENRDKTKVKTSVVTFTASRRHHGKNISCTATYNRQDGSTKSAISPRLTADISFAPQILPSSDCTKAAAQLNCSCETVGNPSPTLQWYLDELPANHSDRFEISNVPSNDTGLRSIITVTQPQETDLSTLLCRSYNSLGSATLRFYVNGFEPQASAQDCSGRVTVTSFIVTVCFLTAALAGALLFAIKSGRTGCHDRTKRWVTGDTSTAGRSQGPMSKNGNQVSITTDEDIYVNNTTMRNMSNVQGQQQVASKCSGKRKREGGDVVYSSVIWKTKTNKGRNLSSNSYQEEERRVEGGRKYVKNALEMESLYDNIGTRKDAKKRVDSEYAQVHF